MIDASDRLPFTESEVRTALGPAVFSRGEAYATKRHVTALRITNNGNIITARVRGSMATPYEVSIFIAPSRNHSRIVFSTTCECPVGSDCKHVAATLVTALRERASVSASPPTALSAPFAHPENSRVDVWLAELRESAGEPLRAPSAGVERVAYLFDGASRSRSRDLALEIVVVRYTKSGRWTKVRTSTAEQLVVGNARAIAPDDIVVGRFLRVFAQPGMQREVLADDIVRRTIATGRAHFQQLDNVPLSLGPPEPATVIWELTSDGSQQPQVRFERANLVLLGAAAWYVDTETWLAGPIETELSRSMLAVFLSAPPLEPAQAKRIRATFAQTMPNVHLPQPLDIAERIAHVRPVPTLTLRTITVPAVRVASWRPEPTADTVIDVAELTFSYDGVTVDPASRATEVRIASDGAMTVYPRSLEDETRAAKRLAPHDFTNDPHTRALVPSRGLFLRFIDDDETERWLVFLHRIVAELRNDGWRIDIDPTFRHRVVDLSGDDTWQAHITEGAGGWFDLAIGLDLDGRRLDLLPMIQGLLQDTNALGNPRVLEALGPEDFYYVSFVPGEPALAFPARRLKVILATLVDLHDPSAFRNDGVLRLPSVRAAVVDELEAALGLRWDLPKRVRALGKRLRTFDGITRVAVPTAFRGELRGYQREGLDWLQFLREYGFGGILADDMGLGKSVQTLAHLLCEKKARRLKEPALLVVPTSLVYNWCDEAARFAPTLRVLTLHGPDRAQRFDEIAQHDLVITTYALLVRDKILRERSWHALILDEAQAVKNPQAKAAQAAMSVRTAHRICLTGTPVENSLTDLWSLFSIALPGALGDRKQFTRVFRTPIEKHGDTSRSRALAERIRPFLLRRTKENVASELPEKTDIVQRVELVGTQRDLYEAVRVAMHRRVRDEIAERGLGRSQIVILDALLKLRQVCCDPRLLPKHLQRPAPSVKLELILEMLPQMIEEGRRVLLFSQFTSMLDLIEPALHEAEIPFVTLTGQTRDRARVVKRFQAREVPLFLISLKAGGTGLNLTAADTVIHYDPWWNPAVERQATDRAHRIGQTQHVFAYKLIGAGTVEEKIVELQARKVKLAAAIIADDGATQARFAADDVEHLFAPLERGNS